MRRLLVLLAVPALAVALATPASAGGPVTVYHGTFDGPTVHHSCTVPEDWQTGGEDEPLVTGNWSVVFRDGKAPVVTVNMFLEGRHHIAYGGAWTDSTYEDSANWSVSAPVAGGGTVTMTLDGGELTYTVTPYHLASYYGFDCAFVDFPGSLTRVTPSPES